MKSYDSNTNQSTSLKVDDLPLIEELTDEATATIFGGRIHKRIVVGFSRPTGTALVRPEVCLFPNPGETTPEACFFQFGIRIRTGQSIP